MNPFLDSLCNFAFKNIGLTPGTGLGFIYLFSSQLEISHVLNGTTPEIQTENEDHNAWNIGVQKTIRIDSLKNQAEL